VQANQAAASTAVVLDDATVAFRLPDAMKLRGSMGKWILRRWLEKNLPVARPFAPKTGFNANAFLNYVGDRWLNKRNTAPAKPYTTWSAGIGGSACGTSAPLRTSRFCLSIRLT